MWEQEGRRAPEAAFPHPLAVQTGAHAVPEEVAQVEAKSSWIFFFLKHLSVKLVFENGKYIKKKKNTSPHCSQMLVVTNYVEMQANRKLPALVLVGGMLVCADVPPCCLRFQAVRQEEEDFCFICSVLALIVLGFILPLPFSCFLRSAAPSFSSAFFGERFPSS